MGILNNAKRENQKDTSEVSGYLYKEADQWYIHLLPDTYKTGKRYGQLTIKVPNLQYPTEWNFYRYLDE